MFAVAAAVAVGAGDTADALVDADLDGKGVNVATDGVPDPVPLGDGATVALPPALVVVLPAAELLGAAEPAAAAVDVGAPLSEMRPVVVPLPVAAPLLALLPVAVLLPVDVPLLVLLPVVVLLPVAPPGVGVELVGAVDEGG